MFWVSLICIPPSGYLGFALSHMRDVSQISNRPLVPPSTSYNRTSPNLTFSLSWFPPVPARGLCTIRPRAVPVLTKDGQMRLLHLPSSVSTLVRQICKSPNFATPESRITACFSWCSLRGIKCEFYTLVGSSHFTPLSPVRKQQVWTVFSPISRHEHILRQAI